MNELKPCPICGKKATVIHLYDSYDKADFGWSCGCPAYKNDDGIHDRFMRVTALTKEDAIKAWNRRVEEFIVKEINMIETKVNEIITYLEEQNNGRT